MSTINFDRSAGFVCVTTDGGAPYGKWPAANNVDSHSLGRWPDGTYDYAFWRHHDGDSPDSAYGTYGICVFTVPGRSGMGLHSGRHAIEDGLCRVGVEHCTLGCIRTTDAAMQAIEAIHAEDPITTLSVG